MQNIERLFIISPTYKEKKKDMENRDVLGLKEIKWKNAENIKQMKDMEKNAEKGFF